MTAAPWPLQVAAAAQLRRVVVCPPSGRTTDRDSGSGCGSGGGGSSVVAPPAAGRCPLRGGVGEMPTPRPRRADPTGGCAAMATGSAASSRCCPRRRPHPPRLGRTMAPRGAGSGAATSGATAPRRWQLRRLLAPAPPQPPAAHCGRAGALAATDTRGRRRRRRRRPSRRRPRRQLALLPGPWRQPRGDPRRPPPDAGRHAARAAWRLLPPPPPTRLRDWDRYECASSDGGSTSGTAAGEPTLSERTRGRSVTGIGVPPAPATRRLNACRRRAPRRCTAPTAGSQRAPRHWPLAVSPPPSPVPLPSRPRHTPSAL